MSYLLPGNLKMPFILHKVSDHILSPLIDKLNRLNHYCSEANFLNTNEIRILNKNKDLENIGKNREIFIIANGPSIKKLDLKLLSNRHTMGMAGIFKHTDIEKINLNYYSVIDPDLFRNMSNIGNIYNEINKKLNKTIKLFNFAWGYKFIVDNSLIDNLNDVYYFASHGNIKSNYTNFLRLTKGWNNVAVFSIALSIYLGYNRIYLLGYDHDYLSDRGLEKHFYEGQLMSGKIKKIYESKTRAERKSYYNEMRDMLNIWEDYIMLLNIAKKRNINIFNCTEGSYLDVFPKLNLNSIIK